MATNYHIPEGWREVGHKEILQIGDRWLYANSGMTEPLASKRAGRTYDYWVDVGSFSPDGAMIIRRNYTWVKLGPLEIIKPWDIIHQEDEVPPHELDKCDSNRNQSSYVSENGYVTCQATGYGDMGWKAGDLIAKTHGASAWRKVMGPRQPRKLPGNPHFAEPLPLP